MLVNSCCYFRYIISDYCFSLFGVNVDSGEKLGDQERMFLNALFNRPYYKDAESDFFQTK